jgi:glycosyltransferase involved in cell wall biosynthesis
LYLVKKKIFLCFLKHEIIVVDAQPTLTLDLQKKYKNIIWIKKFFSNTESVPEQRNYGIKKAKGDVIGFMDAGLDIDPTGVSMLLNHMIWYDADIIVGSKMHPVSKVNYPFYRKILSWGYRTFTRLLFGFKLRDTQTGIKFYKLKVVKDVFPRLLVKNFAFDVEIFALAYALGYKRIYEAPIKLKFKGANTITSRTLWTVVFFMLWDTFSVFYRVRVIKYYRKSNQKNWIKR